MKTILESFLDALDISYTKNFIQKLYQEHPHKYNMYGLKKMLDVYGVKTLGVYIENKNLSELNYPCILHTHGDFVVALDFNADTVKFLQYGKEEILTHDVFRQTWTGNALVVQETTDAVEPDYKKHQRNELISMTKTYIIPVMFMLAVVVGIISNLDDIGVLNIIRIALSSAGILVCVMLMEKQLFGESRYGDKVCSLFHHADCNSVLDGPMAKFFGISWSEVGLGYFIVNILLLSLFPTLSSFIIAVNWVAMLYGIWSIYYQWRIAKSWCGLCVIVQIIIWAMGIIAIVSCLMAPFVLDIVDSLLSCIVFAVSIATVHQYVLTRATEMERVHAMQRYRALKVNNTVARALFEQSEFYETTFKDSSIIFGNPKAKMRVTILSNPHCTPCAKIHRRVEKLLEINGDDVCVQYVFSSFNEELEDCCRYLISCYFNNSKDEALCKFALWYTKEKFDYKKIITINEIHIHAEMIEKEMEKHRSWRNKTLLIETPTILVNGHKLPEEYELEDLAMIANLL